VYYLASYCSGTLFTARFPGRSLS